MSRHSETNTRTAKAYAHIKQLLMEGRLRPGERLPIRDIVESLNMSRQPVITAIQQLAAELLVEIIPQVGSIVRKLDRREVDDFYRYFAQSEALIAELAALRATPEGLEELEEMTRRCGEMLGRELPIAERKRQFDTFNRQFHELLHRLAHSEMLRREAGGLLDRAAFLVNSLDLLEAEVADFARAQRHHEDILDAVRRRDGDAAWQLMFDHIVGSEPARLARESEPQ